jgi:hypothetical protein
MSASAASVMGGTESPAHRGRLGEVRVRPRAHRPPAVVVDGAVAEHLEVLRVVAGRRISLIEAVREAHAFDGRLGDAADARRRFQAQRVQHGRHEVDDMGVLHPQLAASPDARGPGDDARSVQPPR